MSDTSFFGHPRGLATLFFTEMWERFSYYGMRALLALYLTAQIIDGGMGMDAARGSAIVALYTFGVYLLSLPGGWIADRLLGQRKSVLYGGMIIAAGHFALAVPVDASFFFGLILLVVGTGLLKPNVSAIVGDLYEGKGAQRDAGFSIFYMGINIGAFAGPLVCGALGENVDWHLGFGIAGVGMTLGLIQYVMGGKYLRDAGNLKISDDPAQRSRDWKYFFGTAFFCGVIGLAIWMLARNGTIQFTITEFATNTGYICLGLVSLYFAYLIFFAAKNSEERGRIGVIIALFIGAAVFWSGFEQASTGLTYFARDLTDRNIGSLVLPITWLQAINPLFIIILAPVIGGLWIKLDKKNPSFGVKFAMGLVLLGVGFLVLAWGASFSTDGGLSPMWLVVTYFFHTVGELVLSPVGLSAMTKLSPKRLVSQMMGIWFVGAAIGNLIAGLVGGTFDPSDAGKTFYAVAAFVIGAGLIFLIASPVMKRMSHGIN